MQITMLENGIDSIQHGFNSYVRYTESIKGKPSTNKDDYFILKQAILSTHHGVEILLKYILYKQSEFLIVDEFKDDYKKAYKEKTDQGLASVFQTSKASRIHTITYDEALDRVKFFSNTPLNSQLENKLIELNKIRNALTHAEVSVDDSLIDNVFDNLLIELDVLFLKAIGTDYKAFYRYTDIKANYDHYMQFLTANKMDIMKDVVEALSKAVEKTRLYSGQEEVVYIDDISIAKVFLKALQEKQTFGINDTINNKQINTLELITEIERNFSYIPDSQIAAIFSALFSNYNYIISEQRIKKATLHYLINSLFDRMNYNSIKQIFNDSHFDNPSNHEALIIIDFLLSQEHMHSKMLEQSCYGGCKVKIKEEQLIELELICKENLKFVKLFDYEFRDFSMLFYVWRSLDHEECKLFIKHNFFQVENSEAKLVYSLTQKNNESLVLNIREIEMYVDCTELFNRISHKTKKQLLSREEKAAISAFKFYYNNKDALQLDQNGCAEVFDYMIGGEE